VTPGRLSSAILLAFALLALALPDAQAKKPAPEPAEKAASAKHARAGRDDKPRRARGCEKHRAQHFLKRSSFVKGGMLRGREHQRAVRYRVEKYGRIPGLGYDQYNAKTADSYAVGTRFMGLPLRVHEKIAPALRCVEKEIRKGCNKKGKRYVPRAVGGFRQDNSYRGGEVSNHLFGIAIDIDPERNPCCGCVEPWPSNPLCKVDSGSVYDKTTLTRCWIQAFERYGFYWLGRDTLEDTMHFEYLGDPD
jgi:hypothetical protein